MIHKFIGSNAMRSYAALSLIGATLTILPIAQVHAADSIGAEEAKAISVEAYVYFYPLLTMDITRKQFTNIEPGREIGKAPMNMFANMAEYPPADFKGVVRPNFDTLYSSAWLDLSKGPLIVSVPDTNGRYYLLPMLDMWTDVFASPGWRTTGTGEGHFLLAPANWRPDLRDRLAEEFKLPADTRRIDAPTPYVWIIGRTKTDGPADYDAVHQIQAGFKITPLGEWGKAPRSVEVKIDPAVDMKTPPKTQIENMNGMEFFAYAAEVLKQQPPHLTDQAILARLKRIGLEPGKSFNAEAVGEPVRTALANAPAEALKLMEWKAPTLARVENFWSMNTDTMGVYGNYYLKRAIVAEVGLGANQPEDAIYPLNLGDESGQALDGANHYAIHFDKDKIPPVDAFWSITLYDPEGFQVGNPLNRFAVSSWMPFLYNPDGSLDLYFQKDSPGKDKEANWLPAPESPFTLTMRLYAPKSAALTGKWSPPAVIKVYGRSSATQE